MNFGEAISACFQKYVVFEGRSRRSEYWYWSLFTSIFYLIILLLQQRNQSLGRVLWIMFFLLFFLPGLAVTVRRLHDVGKSGWNYLWSFLPILGHILLFIYWCRDSESGENQYGPNPKGIGNNSEQIQEEKKEIEI